MSELKMLAAHLVIAEIDIQMAKKPTLVKQIYLVQAREKQQQKIRHYEILRARTKALLACSEFGHRQYDKYTDGKIITDSK